MVNNNAERINLNELEFSIPDNKIQELKKLSVNSAIVGQDRAVKALELGLGISGEGYNIFVMGAPGTGRRTTISSLLKNYKPQFNQIHDVGYAYNFSKPLEPVALFFPPSKGKKFAAELRKAVENVHKKTLALIKSELFWAEKKKILNTIENEEDRLLMEFEANMLKNGFKVVEVNSENNQTLDLIPIFKGKDITFNELQSKAAKGKISTEELNAIREKYYAGMDVLAKLFSTLREHRIQADERIILLQKKLVKPIIKKELKNLTQIISSYEKIAETDSQKRAIDKLFNFLKKVEKDLLNKIHIYNKEFKSKKAKKIFFGRYCINLICQNHEENNCVITENLPTFTNLFGTIESHNDSLNHAVNGHLKIRSGAVHRAFGGYLIVRLQDLLEEEDSWMYLKRVLQSGKVEIQIDPASTHNPSILKPEPLPADFKVIIIGGEYTYDILYQEDPDFYKLFKVCAEFDSVMQMNDKNMAALINLTDYLCKKKNTLNLTDKGYAKLISYASQIADSRHLLTAQFTKISDLIIEADFNAKKQGKNAICEDVLNSTIEQRYYFHALPEEKFIDMVKLGEIFIDVSGEKIGKINGLAVEERGYHSFGVPVAVTAQASPGTGGVINIEHEAGLSGEIYDKAHLIITSILRQKFSQGVPLALSASICFEQSYSYIDGDSASCAEFLALVSAIGGFPIRQDIAVTGSLNQLGMVQPVGGISEKIHGFFNTCQILGFTGSQGVVIPYSNKSNLFLPKKIIDAVADGKFNIWTIKTIDEGIKLLSGLDEQTYTQMIYDKLNSFYRKINEFKIK